MNSKNPMGGNAVQNVPGPEAYHGAAEEPFTSVGTRDVTPASYQERKSHSSNDIHECMEQAVKQDLAPEVPTSSTRLRR